MSRADATIVLRYLEKSSEHAIPFRRILYVFCAP